ncbi:MAG: accessory Sec-dependent serine-rich glycoprotein adhesin [Coriobacteriales bacterium]|nr:accessory Sec-dependent serine-rich glycoprotein adhesin [Coriobacteriales bacterium]
MARHDEAQQEQQEQQEQQGFDRRSFLKGLAATGAVAAAGALVACSQESPAATGETGGGQPSEQEASASQLNWDQEFDFVVVGSGTGCFGALGATEGGGTAVILEKSPVFGGTTLVSGVGLWIPNNHLEEEFGYGLDSDEESLTYLKSIDAYHGSSDELKEDYVKNAKVFYKWQEETWGFTLAYQLMVGDYYNAPGAKPMGRCMGFGEPDRTLINGRTFYESYLVPKLEERAIPMLTDTTVTRLIQDADGTVLGVEAQTSGSTQNIKGNKGVLLACGGFEWNEEMRDAFLRGPIFGSNSPSTNTGDGILMGMSIGADLANMGSNWGLPCFITDDSGELSTVVDWAPYRGRPHALVVNSSGKRFGDESAAYAIFNNAFYAFDTFTYAFKNLPAWLIFDADHAEAYGWPGGAEEQPEWLGAYDTLEELADACQISKDAFLAEIARFNGFVETGVDEDWHRGEWAFERLMGGDAKGTAGVSDPMAIANNELNGINPCLGVIARAPFYAAQMAPGTCGTSGGLRVNADAQVLDTAGNPIPGLYSAGNNAGAIFGSAYPGGGGTVGPGFYQAFKAANHAFGLGVV